MLKKLLLALIIIGLIFPFLSFSQSEQAYKIPKSIEEAKEIGIRALYSVPNFLKSIWVGFAGFISNLWNNYLEPFLNSLWQKIKTPFEKEFEKRKPQIEKEFEKEKQEMKQEIKQDLSKTLSKGKKSLWQRFKDLIQ